MRSSEVLGALLNAAGSLLINLGNNLQSSGHRGGSNLKNPSNDPTFEVDSTLQGIKDPLDGSFEGLGTFEDLRNSLLGGELDSDATEEAITLGTAMNDKKRTREGRCLWWIGTVTFLCGSIAVFVSYSFAPQSLLAPLGAVQFVSNVVFARIIHGVVITRRMVLSTAVIIGGLALVILFSPAPNPHFEPLSSAATLRRLYSYAAFQVSVVFDCGGANVVR